MVRRALAATALALLLGACGSADLPRDDVAGVVGDAFADAGVEVEDVEVGDEPIDGRPVDVIELEGVLGDLTGNHRLRDPGNYALAVFGDPSAGGPWAWRIDSKPSSAPTRSP